MTWKITSGYNWNEAFRGHIHKGIDFALPSGTELRSINDGVITRIVDYHGQDLGKGIFVKMEDGKTAIYGHLSKFSENLSVGDKVQAGDLLGYSGNSGFSTGSHLHFAIKEDGRFIDPSSYIEHIQNMDNPNLLAKMSESIPDVSTPSDNLFTIGNLLKGQESVHLELLQLFKANFITFISEAKIHLISIFSDYSIFSEYLKHIIQLFLG